MPRIGYLLKKFPRLSETFVLGEILAQEALGAQIHVFSRRAPDDEPRHAELERLRAAVEVLPGSSAIDPWRELFGAGVDTPEVLEKVRDVHSRFASLGFEKFGALLAEALHLLRRTRELEIDHVHVHFATDSAVTAMLLHALGGPTYSITAHAKDIYRNTVDPRRLSALLANSAFTVTVCDANVRHVRGIVTDVAAAKLRRLYNGVDLDAFRTQPSAVARAHRRILSVGRLVEKKGFDVLVDAFALLERDGVEFEATLIGDGEDRALIGERIEALGLSQRVQMLGAVPQTLVREHLALATVFALPCKIGADGNRDALPTVLLEAQAAGAPCVSTPVAGVTEILDEGRAGVLVPQDDARSLADALANLLSDANERERLAAAGAARVRRLFDTRAQARALRAWFDEAVTAERETCVSRT